MKIKMGFGLKRKRKYLRSAFIYSKSMFDITDNADLQALLLCHALEKGMGIPDVKKGYGKEKAGTLIRILHRMESENRTECYVFQESLAILKAYFSFHEADGTDVSELKKQAETLLTRNEKPFHGGYKILSHEELMSGTNCDFDVFAHSRHSMRKYSKEKITLDELKKVISLAKTAPSACNREPWKFYTSLDSTICQQIADGIPKQSFLTEIPYFGLVTVNRSLFATNEINQWYVNGGIFLGFLSMSFHACGIGSCIFQYPVISESSEQLHKLLNIPKDEEIISAVGFGKYPEEAKCIYADRRLDTDFLILK